jgi:hypothetical protein
MVVCFRIIGVNCSCNKKEVKMKLDKKVLLSTLWIFAVLNYLYADVFSFYKADIINQVLKGAINGMQITPTFLFIGALLMETAIIMVVLARFLKYKANRIVNIVFGTLHTLAVAWSLSVGTPAPYYILFATIEIITTVSIVWISWTWKK